MMHDIGGNLEEERIDFTEHALTFWEQSIHALLVILAQKNPPLMTTDELRRCVEGLEAGSYRTWGYYERWAVAMTNLLLERQVISQIELDEELYGEVECDFNETPKFEIGSEVRVKSEDSRLRWRKPHLRCPGYVFNCKGRVEKYIGLFDDPFLIAFRGKGPQQHLYTVSFAAQDIWQEGYEAQQEGESVNEDRVTIEVYEGWLEHPNGDSSNRPVARDIFSSNRGYGVVGSGDKSVFGNDSSSHDHNHQSHGDSNSISSQTTITNNNTSTVLHDHSHDHVHESRVMVECRAVESEKPETPGQRIGTILLRILTKKGIISAASLRDTVSKLESFSDRLLGADLVVKAWMDPEFKARLLSDAPKAAMEIDVVTSNANAPTVLQVVECTSDVHHICVCTLCSCYPSGLLGLSPGWYRSRSYRSRTIREPRKVLAEFGTFLDSSVSVHVHDSTADCRFMVLPLRPKGTEDWTADQLRTIVTRDSMIGISQIILN